MGNEIKNVKSDKTTVKEGEKIRIVFEVWSDQDYPFDYPFDFPISSKQK